MTVETTPPATKASSARAAAPPEWPIERAVKQVGKITGAAGRALDRLAKVPLLGGLVRFLSSVWMGIGVLLMLAIYIAIGSGFASLRARMEMTDLEFFDWYPMRILVTWLALNLIVVTLRRIPLTLFKLGSWTVHVGILTLISGCVWYFSHKMEGAVRIYVGQTQDAYYDSTERALYVFPAAADGTIDQSRSTMTPLPKLPIFYDRLPAEGNGMDRAIPASAFQDLGKTYAGVTARITGYYAAAVQDAVWASDPDADKADPANAKEGIPGVKVSLTMTGESSGNWLLGNSPVGRVLDFPDDPNAFFGIEYLYHPTAEKLHEISAPLTGPLGLVVRVPSKGIDKTYTVTEGQTLAIDGTPYTLTIDGVQPAMQLVSKGYEGAFSNSLMVQVTRKDADKETRFNRMALFRYPERSPDFITGPDGKQQRVQDRVDNDIQLIFQDAQRDQFWVVEGGDGQLTLVHRAAGGKVTSQPVKSGEDVKVDVRGIPMSVGILDHSDHMREHLVPHVVPEVQRKSGSAMDAIAFSALDIEVRDGELKAEHVFVPFVQFAQVGDPPGEKPALVEVPGVGKLGFLLSNTRRPLPSALTLTTFEPVKFPGATMSFADYVSTLNVTDKATGKSETMVAQLNAPAEDHGLYYFQAAWDGNQFPGQRFSVLGVANRPGIRAMIAGAILMILGIGYAFYVKPILLKMKKAQLAQWAAQNKARA